MGAPSLAFSPDLVSTPVVHAPDPLALSAVSRMPKAEGENQESHDIPLAHFAGTRITYKTLKAFNLPMTQQGKFKIVKYSHKDYQKTVSTCIHAPLHTHRPGSTHTFSSMGGASARTRLQRPARPSVKATPPSQKVRKRTHF